MIARPRLSRRLMMVQAVPAILRDAAWITLGSILGAVGTLVGLRLLTESVGADVFGPFVLVNGILALATGVALQPIAQAGLRFHPNLRRRGSEQATRDLMAAAMLGRVVAVAAAIAGIAVGDQWFFGWFSPVSWFFLIITLFVDAIKTIETVMRNAGGDQFGFAALGAADAWARPIGAVALVWLWHPSVEALLLGQLLGAALVAAAFARTAPRPARARGMPILGDLRKYAAPLCWIPLLSWVLSLLDRYVVAGVLGTAMAGVYAAAYGLVSRPMLMLGGIADAVLRQRLYAATAAEDYRGRCRVQKVWFATNALLGGVVVVLLVFAGPWIVAIALAEDYRAAVLPLLLPLGLGHVMILVYQAVVRRLYAFGVTRRVLIADGVAAVTAGVGALIGATIGGVEGVAWAMPIYGTVQLGVALALARDIR